MHVLFVKKRSVWYLDEQTVFLPDGSLKMNGWKNMT